MTLHVDGSPGGPRSEIDVTPLADVVIVLLIVFMVVAPAIATNGVELPRASAGLTSPHGPHEVTIPEDGRPLYDDEPVTLEELEILLTAALASQPDEVRVRADRRLRYASVGPVIETCRRAGARGVVVLAAQEVSR